MTYPFKLAFEDAKAHARREYPKESCGLIVAGKYIACENASAPPETHKEDDPDCACQLCSFTISNKVFDHYTVNDGIDMIIHSHPNGPFFPSKADMQSQVITNVPWAILALDDERVSDPVIWGAEMQPIVGRSFMHGVTDCYALIKDVFKLGRDKLAAQGIDWPYSPITLPEEPRENAWWENGQDLYDKNWPLVGFVEIDRAQAAPGDLFLTKIHSKVYNHAGLLIGGGLIIHHLPKRLSRREPAGLWARNAGRWLRYDGPVDA